MAFNALIHKHRWAFDEMFARVLSTEPMMQNSILYKLKILDLLSETSAFLHLCLPLQTSFQTTSVKPLT